MNNLCQALMGGLVLMLGLYCGYDGILRRMSSPYKGAKILAGAFSVEAIFYDPHRRLDEAQYKGCVVHPIDDQKWGEIITRLMDLEDIFNLGISRENNHPKAFLDDNLQILRPKDFKWILPKGELEGYH